MSLVCGARLRAPYFLFVYGRGFRQFLSSLSNGRSGRGANLASKGMRRFDMRGKSAASAGLNCSPSQMHARAQANSSVVGDQ